MALLFCSVEQMTQVEEIAMQDTSAEKTLVFLFRI